MWLNGFGEVFIASMYANPAVASDMGGYGYASACEMQMLMNLSLTMLVKSDSLTGSKLSKFLFIW